MVRGEDSGDRSRSPKRCMYKICERVVRGGLAVVQCQPESAPTGSRSVGGLFALLVSEATRATPSGHPSGSSAILDKIR